MVMTVEDLLDQLSMSMGVPPLRLDESGLCAFKYNDALDFLILAPARTDQVYLAATLCPIPAENTQCYETLLRMNFLLMETSGATLAIDSEAGMIVACYERSLASFSLVSFPDVVGSFLAIATRLQSEVREAILGGHTAAGAGTDPGGAMIRV
jgi:hypothetical protein